ncbi:MAG: LacI family transcriptional regulator [Oscillospiraceae bacterium]|nr:LacI family transcriptional regulator [Oscillospiraceae bacterium]
MNISEIAKMAGVSNAAVSRYLNNGYLSEEKRAVIRRVIEETGYRPSAQAQTLRTGQTKTVGVILPRIDSFSIGSVMTGIDAALERKGFRLLLADTHNDPAKELEYLDIFGQQHVDGVILIATVFTPAHVRAIKGRKIPLVIVGQHLPNTPCVYHDDYHAFYDMTKLVLKKGCRTLGYIGALPQDRAVGQERSRAFLDAVREAGLPEPHTIIADFSIASGRQKAQELLERSGPLDAMVCATDTIAAGALQYLRSQGIQTPGQMLLTGHGASDVSGVTSPTITTIRYFYEESGAEAAGLLLEQMEKPDLPPKEIKLGYAIVENESTAR